METEVRTTHEYATTVIPFGFMGAGKGKINRKKLEEELTAKGQEGWKLINVWWNASVEGEKDGHLLIYSRPV